jgi:hypothetical protein
MARTLEIPRERWREYLEQLSRRAQAQPIRIEVQNRDIGAQEMARKLPLVGIELETKGSELGDIEVTVGDSREQFTHDIDEPTRMYLKVDDAGNMDCLEIEDGGGGKTLVFFERYPGLPADTGQEVSGYGEHAPGP